MSVRENENKNCSSRGLGLAAAAVGVGVGAALYYFFSKRPENPADEGSTTRFCEEPQVLLNSSLNSSSSSYITISEQTTSDSSIAASPISSIAHGDDWISNSYSGMAMTTSALNHMHHISSDLSSGLDSDSDYESPEETDTSGSEWDVWPSLDGPAYNLRSRSRLQMLADQIKIYSNKLSRVEQMSKDREQAFRNRSWTLEECSICFDGMQKEQEVLTLECSHRFHQACIMPWLQEQQTCPNCRKTF